ncbi:MAG: ABC transporter permease subunit [Hyphomicrobiaceae bacterium]
MTTDVPSRAAPPIEIADNKPKPASSTLFRARPTKPGETYGVPGQGESLLVSAISAAVILGIWSLATWLGWIKPLFLPSPWAIVKKLVDISIDGFANHSLWTHISISVMRVFGALVLACAIAVPMGLAMGMSRIMRGVLDPPLEFYRPVPPLAYLPLMIVWFGIGELSKVLLIFLAILAPVAIGTRSGVRSAAIEQIHAAYSLGATRWQVLWQVILPAALPEIITSIRIGMGVGWTTLVAAEMVAATNGIGFMVLSASEFLQTSTVILGIVIIAAIAYAFDQVMRVLERRLVPWKGRM